ncbi:MAG TPA: glycosyltransferase family 39 protein [Isosphaeraceae bacterium]|nr:glycosyltransferase family 39 protein [Isosphaeraceae bacterium]
MAQLQTLLSRTLMVATFRSATGRLGCPGLAQATLIVVVAGLLWRTVRYALAFPLWGDEAFVAVNFLARNLVGLTRPLEYFQIAPPGFLLAEWLAIHVFGTGERALRLVPYLAGVASLLLFWRFCRGVASRRTVLLAVAMLAASFFPVRHSTEVKPYAIDLLVSLMLISTGWAVGRDLRSHRAWLALFGVTIVGVWCSYAAVFPAAGVALFLGARVVRERSSRLVALWLTHGLLMTLSWGIMFVTFAHPQARAADFLPLLETWRDAFPPLAEPLRLPFWLLEIHTGYMLAYPYGGNDFGSALTTLLVVAGGIRMARRRARRPLLFLLLAPLPVALVAAALHRYPYGTSTRVMLYMAPAFCLLTGEGIMSLLQLRQWSSRGPLIGAGLLALIPLVCTAFNVASPYKAYDDVLHRNLARWVATRTAPGDQWVVFNGASPPPPVKDLMVMPWLQRVGEAHFYLLKYAPVPLHWEPAPETVVPNIGGKIWLIIQNYGDADYFPEGRLLAYQGAFEERFGRPRKTTRFTLPRGESWSICEYSPACRAAP